MAERRVLHDVSALASSFLYAWTGFFLCPQVFMQGNSPKDVWCSPKQKASSSRGFRHWSVQFPDLHNVTGGSYVILPLLPGWLSGSVERQIKESVRGKSGHTVNPIASHRSVYRKWRERHCIVLTPQKKIWSLTGGRDGVPPKDWKQSMKMVLSWAGQACKEKQMLEEGNGNRAKPPWRIQGRTPMISFWASAFGCVSHTAKMSVWDFE